MPIYNFRCQDPDCECEFEEICITFDTNEVKKIRCPKCNKKVKKVPSISARMKANWSTWNALGSD